MCRLNRSGKIMRRQYGTHIATHRETSGKNKYFYEGAHVMARRYRGCSRHREKEISNILACW